MIDINEINSAIKELEQKNTTMDTCTKLATLYTIRDKFQPHDEVVKEYNDILPSYDKYIYIKRKYQLNEATLEDVDSEFKVLCREIYEFLDKLLSTTETASERALILDTIRKTH